MVELQSYMIHVTKPEPGGSFLEHYTSYQVCNLHDYLIVCSKKPARSSVKVDEYGELQMDKKDLLLTRFITVSAPIQPQGSIFQNGFVDGVQF